VETEEVGLVASPSVIWEEEVDHSSLAEAQGVVLNSEEDHNLEDFLVASQEVLDLNLNKVDKDNNREKRNKMK
jgi:hypothetical protein